MVHSFTGFGPYLGASKTDTSWQLGMMEKNLSAHGSWKEEETGRAREKG